MKSKAKSVETENCQELTAEIHDKMVKATNDEMSKEEKSG